MSESVGVVRLVKQPNSNGPKVKTAIECLGSLASDFGFETELELNIGQ